MVHHVDFWGLSEGGGIFGVPFFPFCHEYFVFLISYVLL